MKIGKFDLTWAKVKASWEYRSLAFIGKFFGIILFIFYVYVGGGSAYAYFNIHYIKSQPADTINWLVYDAAERSDTAKLVQWIHYRPQSETDTIIDVIKGDSGRLDYAIFSTLMAKKAQQGAIEEALFWGQLSRYRLRYDLLRCNDYSEDNKLEKIMGLFSLPEVDQLLADNPALIKKSIQGVLDFDAKYPAENNPANLCKLMARLEQKEKVEPIPAQDWPAIRGGLRSFTEKALKDM